MEDFLFLPEWLRGLQSGSSVTQDSVISDSVFGTNKLYIFCKFCKTSVNFSPELMLIKSVWRYKDFPYWTWRTRTKAITDIVRVEVKWERYSSTASFSLPFFPSESPLSVILWPNKYHYIATEFFLLQYMCMSYAQYRKKQVSSL